MNLEIDLHKLEPTRMAFYTYYTCSSYNTLLLLAFFTFSRFLSVSCVDPTDGFVVLPFNASFYHVQKPYNVVQNKRYSFVDGVQKLWVFANDKPHFPSSHTKPRTEIGIQGYEYSSGVWQFEGYGYVPQGTSGVCIMQVFGAIHPYAANLMLHVYNGNLMYYKDALIVPNIYNKWFRLNVIHHVRADKLKVFIDGQLKLKANGRGRTTHTFKYGVYAQDDNSHLMESHWKNITILKKR